MPTQEERQATWDTIMTLRKQGVSDDAIATRIGRKNANSLRVWITRNKKNFDINGIPDALKPIVVESNADTEYERIKQLVKDNTDPQFDYLRKRIGSDGKTIRELFKFMILNKD